jgi:hypothetical protein
MEIGMTKVNQLKRPWLKVRDIDAVCQILNNVHIDERTSNAEIKRIARAILERLKASDPP